MLRVSPGTLEGFLGGGGMALGSIGSFIRRQFSLDNFIGQLLWLGLLTVSSTVLGAILRLPVVTLVGIAVSAMLLAVAGILAWREGWRPGTMRGVRGWTATVNWHEAVGPRLLLSLWPPEGTDVVQPICELHSPGGRLAFSHDQVRPPRSSAANGEWNPYYFVVVSQSFEDGRYQVRWRIAHGLGWLGVASRRFRIKRGRLVE